MSRPFGLFIADNLCRESGSTLISLAAIMSPSSGLHACDVMVPSSRYGSVGNAGVSRSDDAPSKAPLSERQIGMVGGLGLLPNPRSKRPCYAASIFPASSRLARIIFLAASGSFFRFSSRSSCIFS